MSYLHYEFQVQPLFWNKQGATLSDFLSARLISAKNEIEELKLEDFEKNTLESVLESAFKKHQFNAPKFEIKSISVEHKEEKVRNSSSSGIDLYQNAYYVSIDFSGDKKAMSMRPSSHRNKVLNGAIYGRKVVIKFVLDSTEGEKIDEVVDERLSVLFDSADRAKADCEKFNANLRIELEACLKARKLKVEATKSGLSTSKYINRV